MRAILAMLFAASATAGLSLPLRWLTLRGGSVIRSSLVLYATGTIPFAVAWLARPESLDPSAALLGALCGASSAGALIASVVAMRHGKAGPTTLVVFMSSAAPILVGRLVGWDGPIAAHKFAGIALGVLAVCLCTLHKDDLGTMKSRRRWLAFALLGMLLNGIASVALKAVAGLGLGGHAVVFNLLFFPAGTAIAAGLIPLAARGRTFRGARWKMESAVGVAVGLLGAAQLASSLYAVPRIHSAVIFPTYAIMPLVLTSLGGRVLFGERLGPLERTGLVTACAALAMLNV